MTRAIPSAYLEEQGYKSLLERYHALASSWTAGCGLARPVVLEVGPLTTPPTRLVGQWSRIRTRPHRVRNPGLMIFMYINLPLNSKQRSRRQRAPNNGHFHNHNSCSGRPM